MCEEPWYKHNLNLFKVPSCLGFRLQCLGETNFLQNMFSFGLIYIFTGQLWKWGWSHFTITFLGVQHCNIKIHKNTMSPAGHKRSTRQEWIFISKKHQTNNLNLVKFTDVINFLIKKFRNIYILNNFLKILYFKN